MYESRSRPRGRRAGRRPGIRRAVSGGGAMAITRHTTYDLIRELKRQSGHPISQLLALDRKNDPFYVGSALDWEQAHWFAEIWRGYGFGKGAHLRRIHYRVAVTGDATKHDGKPYENTEVCWNNLD